MEEYKGLKVPNVGMIDIKVEQAIGCAKRINSKNNECNGFICETCIFNPVNLEQYIEWEKENIGGEDAKR